MQKDDDLNTRFWEAFDKASNMTEASLPQDVMLRIYAYYKQATTGDVQLRQFQTFGVRDGFKMNAWMQVKHLTPNEAKERYIELINSVIK